MADSCALERTMASKLRTAKGAPARAAKKSMKRTMKRVVVKSQRTFARLDQWARAQVCAYRQAGKPRDEICSLVEKKDGTHPTLRAVDAVLEKKAEDPGWRGEDSRAGGRPRALSKAQRRQLTNLVFRERGKAVVTAPFCQKRLPFLRTVTEQTVRNELQLAGLKWLRRRRKTAVLKRHKAPRKLYCTWVKAQAQSFLNKFCYTDGTTFYLARGPAEQEGKQRAALGPWVWRMANGKDGLWDENVGPSLYAKSQGLPVKIWGMFANGRLFYHVLPKDKKRKTTNMNTKRYGKLVRQKFAKWRVSAFRSKAVRPHLVQDHEGCLWKDANLKALSKAGFHVLKNYPKCSPDLNAIEGWWRRLRQLLNDTAPADCETRPMFLRRLRATVNWMNKHLRQEALGLCRNQKVRADDVLRLQGAKSKW